MLSPFSRKKSFPSNPALRILLLTNSLILMAVAMVAPIYALLVSRIGGDLLDASLTGSVFAVVAGMTLLVSGQYADKKKARRRIVILGYCLIGIAFLLYTVVSNIWWLLLVQVLIGLGEAIYAPAFDGLYSSHLDDGFESREWGNWEATHYFSTAIGALAGGLIVRYIGFNALFVTMAVFCFGSALYIGRLPKRRV